MTNMREMKALFPHADEVEGDARLDKVGIAFGASGSTVNISFSYKFSDGSELKSERDMDALSTVGDVQTVPILDHYQPAVVVTKVDANKKPDEVWESIAPVLPRA